MVHRNHAALQNVLLKYSRPHTIHCAEVLYLITLLPYEDAMSTIDKPQTNCNNPLASEGNANEPLIDVTAFMSEEELQKAKDENIPPSENTISNDNNPHKEDNTIHDADSKINDESDSMLNKDSTDSEDKEKNKEDEAELDAVTGSFLFLSQKLLLYLTSHALILRQKKKNLKKSL